MESKKKNMIGSTQVNMQVLYNAVLVDIGLQASAFSSRSRGQGTTRRFVVLQSPVQHGATLRGENVPKDSLGMHCEGSPSQPLSGHPEYISNTQPLLQTFILQ